MGRRTFEKVLSFEKWPYEKKVFILSTHLKQIPDNLRDKAEIISLDPRSVIEFLSKKKYMNIYIDGGKVIRDFLEENCIDELIITRVPVLIGKGIPFFGLLNKDLQFRHIETKVYSNGLVKTHYVRI